MHKRKLVLSSKHFLGFFILCAPLALIAAFIVAGRSIPIGYMLQAVNELKFDFAAAISICGFSVLLILKLGEMWSTVCWTMKRGAEFMQILVAVSRKANIPTTSRSLIKTFGDQLPKRNYPLYPDSPSSYALTFHIRWAYEKVSPWPILQKLIDTTFAYPVLMFILAVLNFVPLDRSTHNWIIGLLVVGLMTEIVLLTAFRLKYGPIDSFFSSYSAQNINNVRRLPSMKRDRIGFMASIFLVNFVVIVVSFGSIYHALSHNSIPNNFVLNTSTPVRQHPANVLDSPIDAIYFSTATLCTVGYGDFVPIGPYARLFTILQMLLGFSFFVLLLAVFGSSMDIVEIIEDEETTSTESASATHDKQLSLDNARDKAKLTAIESADANHIDVHPHTPPDEVEESTFSKSTSTVNDSRLSEHTASEQSNIVMEERENASDASVHPQITSDISGLRNLVWATASSKIYHKPTSKLYKKTASGTLMEESDAIAKGYRQALSSSRRHAVELTPQ